MVVPKDVAGCRCKWNNTGIGAEDYNDYNRVASGYEYADAPDIEVYLNPDPQNAQYEVWIPVAKKKA